MPGSRLQRSIRYFGALIGGIGLALGLSAMPSFAEQSAAKSPAATEAYNAGTAAVALGDLAKAETEFQKAVKLSPDNADMQLALGKVLLHRGDLAGAAIHMLAAINAKPGMAQAHFYLGQILSAQGEWEQAVLQLREAAKLAPKDADPHRALARAMSAQGKTPEALDGSQDRC